jgi:hypothetical protein
MTAGQAFAWVSVVMFAAMCVVVTAGLVVATVRSFKGEASKEERTDA